jgi:1-acyl-sn-glycerol-3-phosphate acyltransferase
MHPLLRALRARVDRDDPSSANDELIRSLTGPFERLGRAWYRLELDGWENLPDGPALLVGNHDSGTAFVEALCAGAQLVGRGHKVTGLAHDAVIDAPLLGRVLAQVGGVRANHDSADRAFRAGRKVVVFPGGNLEAFRPWRDRHRVVFGGRKGFVRLALRHQVPIVPWVFCGGHSGFFVLRDGQRLARHWPPARWLRSDTWPVYVGLPWGVCIGPWPHIPLPVKVRSGFLPAIPTDGVDPEDESAIDRLVAEVVASLQKGLDDRASRPTTRRGSGR